jgi:hypothetical protein
MTQVWEDSSLILYRNLINDISEPYTYTDCRLLQLLLTSAFLNLQNIDFSNDYTVDLLKSEITPDPPESSFLSLMVLKAVALLATSEWKTEARKAIVVRDGPSSIDATELVNAKKDYAIRAQEQFDKAVLLHKTGNYNLGIAIVGPGRFDYVYNTQERFY